MLNHSSGLRETIQAFVVVLAIVVSGLAQTTQFGHQGSLIYNGQPANGNFDLEFRLYDTASGGSQQGATVQRSNVVVNNGAFTVTLDFSFAVFTGADRFLETAARPSGTSDPFVVSSPRDQVLSTPYSIRSLNSGSALQLGGVDANQYVVTTDPRMTDARPPLPNSGNYIQNTTAQQPASNFNISGNGTAAGTLSSGVVNAATQYDLAGARILAAPGSSVFVGTGAGQMTTGSANSFFGKNAGFSNTTGNSNSFFGYQAGYANTTGVYNSFFGRGSGDSNTTGNQNSFFGFGSGSANTSGTDNTIVGFTAGNSNTSGHSNSFFGSGAGVSNTTGVLNSFFGYRAGYLNTTGSGNVFFGRHAGYSNTDGWGNSLVGDQAGNSNTTGYRNSFVGGIAGFFNTSGHHNSFFGFYSGDANTTGVGNTFSGYKAGYRNSTGSYNTAIGYLAQFGSNNLTYATAIGSEAIVNTNNTVVLGRLADTVRVPGYLVVSTVASGVGTTVCRSSLGYLSNCSSSIRYKTDVRSLTGGLDIINRLRPVTFSWRDGGVPDIGFVAEEVDEVEPRLVTRNDKGEVEGVKYDRVAVVLLNAVKTLQAKIETQQKQIETLQRAINKRRRSVSRIKPRSGIIKEK